MLECAAHWHRRACFIRLLNEKAMVDKLTHLKELEAESIHIIREVAAEFDNPVMLYSIGKDSAVMLHLAKKAFFPGKLPFPVLHVDTRWKFQEMYRFREKMVSEYGLDLLTLVQAAIASALNLGVMDEDVLGAICAGNKAVTLGCVEPLDRSSFSLRHVGVLLLACVCSGQCRYGYRVYRSKWFL